MDACDGRAASALQVAAVVVFMVQESTGSRRRTCVTGATLDEGARGTKSPACCPGERSCRVALSGVIVAAAVRALLASAPRGRGSPLPSRTSSARGSEADRGKWIWG